MIERLRGIIGRVRDLGRRLLIGIAALATGAMVVGYAYIFGGIATPPGGDLGTVAVPERGTAVAIRLDDGRPAFVVVDEGARPWVLDAEAPGSRGTLRSLVAWCPDARRFIDPMTKAVYAADGRLLAGGGGAGLLAYALRSETIDKPTSLIVGSQTEARGVRADTTSVDDTCSGGTTAHGPEPGEVFDPSVAADQEPPGWIWLEGTLSVVDGATRLCDGVDGSCDGAAEVVGIDPASVQTSRAGRFLGRMREGAVEGLALIADTESTEAP